MATTTTAGTVSTVTTSWIKQHERIVCLTMILLFGGWGLSKYFDVDSARKDAKNVAAQQQLADAKANSVAQAQETAQMQSQYTALVTALAAQNASLAASIAQRTASQKTQVVADAALPPSGLAARWAVLIPTVEPIVTPTGLSVTTQEAHDTVAALESVPVLTQNLKDETTLAGNYQQEWQKALGLSADQTTQIAGLNTQLTTQANACKVEVAAIKADARKSKIKWFKIGFVSGFLGGLWGGSHGL